VRSPPFDKASPLTIRFKILALALVILIIFGVVVGISTWLQHKFTNQIIAITRYHIPLRTLIADFDVRTDEYELITLRLLRQPAVTQGELEHTSERARQDAKRIAEDMERFDALVDSALIDPTISRQSESIFSELKGATPFIKRQLDRFFRSGELVLQAVAEGRLDDARGLSLEFRKTEDAFGPDTAALRDKLALLTATVGDAALSSQKVIQALNLTLFALAGCLGIGAGIFVSAHIVRALRRLAEGTAAVQAGQFMVTVPVETNDEVGQLATAFNRMVEEIRTREKIKEAFGKFVDPRIVANLIATTSGDIDRAERQVVTVFFSDIAGFTSMSEQLTASAIVNMLNHYFTAVTAPIREHHGFVDKYIGDGLMAFWAAPFSPGDTHAASACLAAVQQQMAIDGLNKDLPNLVGLRRGAPTLRVHMGIATGEVIVGTIGSAVSKSFTVIGDTVNVASRLVGANDLYGTRIVVSEDAVRLARQEVEFRELDLITVVGRSEPIRIFELLGPTGNLQPGEDELATEFDNGLKAYRARDWMAAERHFKRCLEIRPEDRPSALYLSRITEMRINAPPADWNGVWHLHKK
jgi:adenylate cyclase